MRRAWTTATSRLRAASRSPLAWILAVVFVLGVVGIDWGLPASDGWDNDGIAPRDFLPGVFETFTPGKYFTYPPLHLVLLSLLTLPITLVALANAQSFAAADLVHEATKVPYMTVIALAARFTTLAMALGIVYAMAKIAEELRGKRAGWCVAATCAVNMPFIYYAHTTNLDVPYLFWSCLGLLALVRAIARREPRRLRWAVAFAVLAIATKDQAYAVFLFAAPAAIVSWLALDPSARARWREIAREVAVALVIGVLLLGVADAIVFNPTGFRARVAFLVGPASQDYAHYTNDWHGRLAVISDSLGYFSRYYPIVFAPLAALGLVGHVVRNRADRSKLVAGLVPLMAIVSFTLAFNCIARRTDHRFLLPQSIFIAAYIGDGVELLVFEVRQVLARRVGQLALLVAFGLSLYMCLAVDANLLLDPRYEAEQWLRAHVAPGDTIETYGLNVYLPRFPAQAHVVRVAPEPIEKRSPLPGVEEVRDSYDRAEERAPRWLVVSQGWAWRYLLDVSQPTVGGHVIPPTQLASGTDADATRFFPALLRGERGFARAHDAVWQSHVWPHLDIHASTAREVWIFERRSSQPSP